MQDRMADMLTQVRRHADHDRHDAANVGPDDGADRDHALHGCQDDQDTVVDINELRDHIADFDDFFRPIRNYFYWEPHCFDIPRLLVDAIGLRHPRRHRHAERRPAGTSSPDLEQARRADAAAAHVDAADDRDHEDHAQHDADHVQTQNGMQDQMQAMQQNATAMGQAFDASKNDDSFYLPPEVFDNPDFKRGLKMFVSPDGKAVRFIISHEGDPATAEGISHIDADQECCVRSHQGHTAGGLQDLPRRHRGDLQGHAARFELRPA